MALYGNWSLEWIYRHIHEHPLRLFATTFTMFLASLCVLGAALYVNLNAAHAADVRSCQAVNELSRKIYITLADFGVPQHEREKYRPTERCEDLP